MQIIQSKSNFVEKVLRDKEGRLVRARFCVYESQGRIKARLIDFVYIEEKALTGKTLSLPSSSSQYSIFNILYSVRRTPSPFVSEILYSIGSKPRAPTL